MWVFASPIAAVPSGQGKTGLQVQNRDAIDDERLMVGTPESGMPPTAPSFENLDAEVFTETGHFGGPHPHPDKASTDRAKRM
jgi:hypothetical protein